MDKQIEQLLENINNFIERTELNENTVGNFVFKKLKFNQNGFAIFSKKTYKPNESKLKGYQSKYRYYYYEKLNNTNGNKGSLIYLMFNPAAASPDRDDATIKNCRKLACDNEYDSIEVINLFAERNPAIKDLKYDEGTFNIEFVKEFIEQRQNNAIVIACGKAQGKKYKEKICELIESCTNKYVIQVSGKKEFNESSSNEYLCLINRHPANQGWSKYKGFKKAAELCKCPN